MYKSEYRLFTVKLYPNATQVEIIENTLDACDKLWNHYLEKQVQPGFETLTRESPRIFEENEARKELTQMRQTEEFSYLSDIDRTALNQHLRRLDNAVFHARYNPNFFGRPKAKDLNANIRSYTSCVTSVDREKHTASIEIDQSRQMLKVPKLRWVKYRAGIIPYYDFQIKQVTIKSIHKQEYYGILLLEVFSIQLIPIMFNPVDVGIDLGLKHFATLSTGEKIPHFRYAREKLDTLIKLDCEMKAILNTNGKDSSEFAHIIRKIQRLHADIANRRRNQINVISWNLLNRFDILFIERIQTTRLIKDTNIHNIKAAYYDSGFNMFIQTICSHATRIGKCVYLVPEEYGSSKYCNVCGCSNTNLDILNGKHIPGYTREWTCSQCGAHHDRDINAAINIRTNGRWMLNSPGISAYQDLNHIEHPKYPILNNGLPNISKINAEWTLS